MATTINTGFSGLRKNLGITDLQAKTVSTRQQNVREAVAQELDVVTSFLTGSYMRDTMIAPLSKADVDIFVVLDPKYYEQNGQTNLLDRVKRVLKKTYPKTPEISRNGQAVTISFTDFEVDVVPAFNRNGGGYLIPNTYSDTWVSTDPKKHIDIWSDANKAHNGDLVPLIKMLKCWNREHSRLLRTFHLETLALKVFANVNISSFPSGALYFFQNAQTWIGYTLADPAGYDGIGSYLNTSDKQKDVRDRLQTACQKALDAEAYANDGGITEAFNKWRIVFGDYFPAYG
jgi:hypothetical protein